MSLTKQAMVVFSHGLDGSPEGEKISRLSKVAHKRDCQVLAPDYRDQRDPDQRVDRLLSYDLKAAQPLILVGSSMGGYVSVAASEVWSTCGLFLMAPALNILEFGKRDPKPNADFIQIVHGWHDELIPAKLIVDYAQKYQLSATFVADDHRLSASLDDIEVMFDWFLKKCLFRESHKS